MRAAMDIPYFTALRDLFKYTFDLAVSDNASANHLAEQAMAQFFFVGIPRLRLRCQIHKLHTITGRVLAMVKGYISGIVSLGLVLRPGSTVE